MNPKTFSSKAVDLVKFFEGYRGTAYKDSVGVWTIGYGHTHNVKQGDVIDQETAELLLKADMSLADKQLQTWLLSTNRVTLNQNRYDALVSFIFNCGFSAFAGSTLAAKVAASDFKGAEEEFSKWVTDGNGNTIPGLVTRRAKEAELFRTPVDRKYILVCPPEDWRNASEVTESVFNALQEVAQANKLRYRVDQNKLYLGIQADVAKQLQSSIGATPTPTVSATQQATNRWFKYHLVCSLRTRTAKLYKANGVLLGTYPVRGEGVNGSFAWTGKPLWNQTGSDTPPGTWRISAYERIGTRTTADIPYGRLFLWMEPLSGEAKRLNRPGIGAHGGGSGLANPFADRQGWVVTHGCLRFQNSDLDTIFSQIVEAGKIQPTQITTTWT